MTSRLSLPTLLHRHAPADSRATTQGFVLQPASSGQLKQLQLLALWLWVHFTAAEVAAWIE